MVRGAHGVRTNVTATDVEAAVSGSTNGMFWLEAGDTVDGEAQSALLIDEFNRADVVAKREALAVAREATHWVSTFEKRKKNRQTRCGLAPHVAKLNQMIRSLQRSHKALLLVAREAAAAGAVANSGAVDFNTGRRHPSVHMPLRMKAQVDHAKKEYHAAVAKRKAVDRCALEVARESGRDDDVSSDEAGLRSVAREVGPRAWTARDKKRLWARVPMARICWLLAAPGLRGTRASPSDRIRARVLSTADIFSIVRSFVEPPSRSEAALDASWLFGISPTAAASSVWALGVEIRLDDVSNRPQSELNVVVPTTHGVMLKHQQNMNPRRISNRLAQTVRLLLGRRVACMRQVGTLCLFSPTLARLACSPALQLLLFLRDQRQIWLSVVVSRSPPRVVSATQYERVEEGFYYARPRARWPGHRMELRFRWRRGAGTSTALPRLGIAPIQGSIQHKRMVLLAAAHSLGGAVGLCPHRRQAFSHTVFRCVAAVGAGSETVRRNSAKDWAVRILLRDMIQGLSKGVYHNLVWPSDRRRKSISRNTDVVSHIYRKWDTRLRDYSKECYERLKVKMLRDAAAHGSDSSDVHVHRAVCILVLTQATHVFTGDPRFIWTGGHCGMHGCPCGSARPGHRSSFLHRVRDTVTRALADLDLTEIHVPIGTTTTHEAAASTSGGFLQVSPHSHQQGSHQQGHEPDELTRATAWAKHYEAQGDHTRAKQMRDRIAFLTQEEKDKEGK